MKIIKNATIYKCDFCNRRYERKHFAIKHEIKCSSNPDNWRACQDYTFLEFESATIHTDNYYGEEKFIIDIFKCTKKNVFIYPPKVEHKKNYFLQEGINNSDIENIPMPKKCELYENELFNIGK